jgi:acetoacetate decarboxylase
MVSWVKTEGSGFGSYNKVEVHIPCKNQKTGEMCSFSVLSFLDNSSPITAGREIYGQPQKFGNPSLVIFSLPLILIYF